MTPAAQKSNANKNKLRGQYRFQLSLSSWIREILTHYAIGDMTTTRLAIPVLREDLQKGYKGTSKDVLTFNIEEYKQLGDDDPTELIFKDISVQVGALFVNREIITAQSVTSTANKHVARITKLAVENGWSLKEAKTALANTLKTQRLTIAVTESQWTVETTRRIAVLSVKDPLNNTVDRVAQLIQSGDTNAAVRLARKVNKLARLPVSVSEGELIRTIYGAAENSRAVSPLAQGRAIANMRERAEELGTGKGKQWETFGDGKVRASHEAVNGMIVDNVDEPFILAGGALQYPGDISLGAGPEETINCRCAMIYL